MARIPAQVVERLKAEVSVHRLAEARGVAFKSHVRVSYIAASRSSTAKNRWLGLDSFFRRTDGTHPCSGGRAVNRRAIRTTDRRPTLTRVGPVI